MLDLKSLGRVGWLVSPVTLPSAPTEAEREEWEFQLQLLAWPRRREIVTHEGVSYVLVLPWSREAALLGLR